MSLWGTVSKELASGRSQANAALSDSQRLHTMMMRDMRTLKEQADKARAELGAGRVMGGRGGGRAAGEGIKEVVTLLAEVRMAIKEAGEAVREQKRL